MPKPKTLIIFCASAVLFLAIGFWLGKQKADQTYDRYFIQIKSIDVTEKVKILDQLYSNDSEKAIGRLETWLDRDALVLGAQNEKVPRKIKTEEKEVLQLIADHRIAHPFVRPNSPGVNEMVHKALQNAK